MSKRGGYKRNGYPRYISKGMKYQFVPFCIEALLGSGERVEQVLVPQSTVQGIRKVKNFNFNVTTNIQFPVLWAIIYLPEGGDIQQIKPNTNAGKEGNPDARKTFVELFAANQWVIGCGTCISGAVQTFKTRMARNLNGGDSVWMILWSANADGGYINITGNYAIRYN